MERSTEPDANPKKFFSLLWGPVWSAFLVAVVLAAIIFPYWWLVVQWSSLYFIGPGLRFTFITTTFLLILIIVDSIFLIRYYQIVRKREIEEKARELQQIEKALRLANKKLSLLSSITRHDILNQIMGLRTYLELSREDLKGTKFAEFVEQEDKAAEAIQRQIEFSKEYEDIGVTEPIWQNVDACMKKAQASLPMRDVRVVIDCPDVEVFADPLFEKVFYNLIDNALRYGGSAMTTIWISSQESGRNLIIFVEDDGVGISSEHKRHLFERGFGHHTGLGLFLSREILSITGITIAETGEPGKGARFEIVVPIGSFRK
jgi:signal transduction histidine kinase